MKKLLLTACAVAGLAASSLSNAAPMNYTSTLHPGAGAALNATLHPPTDITIINATNNYIYAVVPGSPINDALSPGFNDHIYNNNASAWTTYVLLQDPYRNTFFANNVCRLAIVTVYGAPGAYRLNIDNDLCN